MNCENIYGCPDEACDGDRRGSWCVISNPGCDTEEAGGYWSYCTPGNSNNDNNLQIIIKV